MGNLLGRAFGLTISLEEKSRYYAMYGIGANYWKNKWLNFPVICCIILDMIISLYLALQMQSYSLPNVLFHLLIFPMVYSAWDFTYFNDHTRPRIKEERSAMCYWVFFINIFFSVPFIVIKIFLLSMYIPDISTDILPSPLTPLSFLIIWALISLPFIIKYQVIFGLFYWVTFSFVLILLCLTFPGFWFRRRYPFYVLDRQKLDEMMDNVGDNLLQKFLIKNKISDDEEDKLAMMKKPSKCNICSCELMTDLFTVKLTCNHKFHSACIERLFAQKFQHWCPTCNKNIHLYPIFNDNNISEADKQKSLLTKLHYYLLLLSNRPLKYYPIIYIAKKSLDSSSLKVIMFILLMLFSCAPILLALNAMFTDNQSICVLSNSFVLFIIFQYIAYSNLNLEFSMTKEDLNLIWTDHKMQSYETYVCINFLYQFSLFWNLYLLALSSYIIIPNFETFTLSEYILFGFLIYLDVFCHCALNISYLAS